MHLSTYYKLNEWKHNPFFVYIDHLITITRFTTTKLSFGTAFLGYTIANHMYFEGISYIFRKWNERFVETCNDIRGSLYTLWINLLQNGHYGNL